MDNRAAGPSPTLTRRGALRLACAGGLALAASASDISWLTGAARGGYRAPSASLVRRPLIEAYFTRRSYAPGQSATLLARANAAQVVLQIFRIGPSSRSAAGGPIAGAPVTDAVTYRWRGKSDRWQPVALDVHYWPSGVYVARLKPPRGPAAFAPFVVRSDRFGSTRTAVVLPTNTWQAYNHRDDNGDGIGDTWYATTAIKTVRLNRPFQPPGLPPFFRRYDLGFLRWMDRTGRDADYLTDDDLDNVPSGDVLAASYDLIVFPGHHEYVTSHQYDVIERFRDLGGNLMFLSANNFFYRVRRSGQAIVRAERFRDLGRPEAALMGAQYATWNQNRYRNQPYRVTGTHREGWIFEGTGLRNGDRFGNFGIEIDARTPASPPGTRQLAEIPNIFGPGRTAEMTYYTTPRGAKVFSAGAFTLGGSAHLHPTSVILSNLWDSMAAGLRP